MATGDIGGSDEKALTGTGRLPYQPSLDGLRCISIAVVMGFHFGFPIFKGGNIGVDIFFVLSGFLITTLLLRERALTGTISLRSFWRRRARRLLPALLIVCVVVVALYALTPWASGARATAVGAASALAYISSIVAAFDLWSMGWMGHTWSLSVEEIFYAVFPLAAIVMLRRFNPRWIYAAAAIAIAYYLIAANVLHLPGPHLYAGPDSRAEQLLIGCALAVLLERSGEILGLVSRTVLMVLSVIFLAAWIVKVSYLSDRYLDGGETLVAVAAAAVVWYLMTVPTGWVTRALALPALVWVGVSSMSTSRRVVVAALVVPASLAVAGVSYRYLESRFTSRRPMPAPGTA